MRMICLLTAAVIISGCFVRPGWGPKEKPVLYINTAVHEYHSRHGRLPAVTRNKDLIAVLQEENLLRMDEWNDRYIKDGIALDYWGNPLIFAPDGKTVFGRPQYVYSAGPNGTDENGQGDDFFRASS